MLKIEPRLNLVYVVGSVPGDKGGYVTLRDSLGLQFTQPPPFPTYLPTRDPPIADEVLAGPEKVMLKRGKVVYA